MKYRKIFLITIISILILVILGGIGFYIKSPDLFHCYFIGASNDFTEVKENLYISNDTPETLKDSLISVLRKADNRVCKFWETNKRKGNPVIIFCYSKSLLSEYSKNNFLITYKTPFNCFIVLYKDRINLDMLSHELFHTEFCERIGFFKNTKIPVWFDEGLAMQVDYRKEYSEEKYLELKDSIENNIRLSNISAPETFYAGNFYYHFVLARFEVNEWIKELEKESFHSFIDRINNGEDFYSVYNELKNERLNK
jgi:hypothetical protein